MKHLLKKKSLLKDKKGVAGLQVFLSVLVMLFVIGFLVMIFSLIGGELSDQLVKDVTNNVTAATAINDTYVALAGATDWFGIIIIISVMVVLILLTVIIISAIRGSGLIAGG